MKLKFLILGGFFAFAFNVNAQTEKGKQLIGGSLGFVTLHSEQGASNSKQNSISIGPKYGYFVGNNFVIGLDASYNFDKMTSSYQQTIASNGNYQLQTVNQLNQSSNISIGTFARHYIDINEKFKFFGQFNASIGFGRNKQTNSIPAVAKTIIYSTSLSPSIAFFPTKKLAIELGFSLISYFNTKSNSYPTDYRTEAFAFGLDTFEPKIGVNFHL